ncbi:MAG: ParB N-terminal domain-containing protein [Kiritimatiellae bacterium]|nr:ParB N-terminal domain-containing protein [Kiritimatiellia bacterium]
MKVVNVPVSEIVPYENNPRINEGAVEQLANIIATLGFRNPAVLNKDKVIIEGHTRLLAVKKLGWETMPCIIATDLTPEQEQALRIADNKIAEIAEWDEEKLKVELSALQEAGFDLSLLAFGDDELDELLGGEAGTHGETEPDAAPEVPEVAVSKPGEVYKLGKHLLVCGDSTKAEDVAKVCKDGEADLWLTDPPYNVDYHGSDGQSIRNDSMEDSKFREFLRTAFGHAEKALKPGGSFYIFHADSEGYNFRGACFDVGLRVRQCLIWKKQSLVLGRQDYHWIHEPCLYGWKEGEAHNWYADRSQTTVMEFDKPKKNDVHPTMKPVEMLCYLIGNSSKRGDTVLDTFGGSGSTLIACERTGRVCRTVELDPKYCDVIRQRWAEFVHGEGCDWERLAPAAEAARMGDEERGMREESEGAGEGA